MAQTGLGVEDYTVFSLVCLSKKRKKKERKKQAINKNFTSRQARILFWKKEVCGSFPSWPSKSLAVIEPERDVLCTVLGGGYLWHFCGCTGGPEPWWWVQVQLSASLPFDLCSQVTRAPPSQAHSLQAFVSHCSL